MFLPQPPPQDVILRTFNRVTSSNPPAQRIQGQQIITVKDSDAVFVFICDHQSTFDRNPTHFRTEGTLRSKLFQKEPQHFVVVGDGKSVTTYDRTHEQYTKGPLQSASDGFFVSVLGELRRRLPIQPSVLASVTDPKALDAIRAILPQLMAKEGLSDVSSRVETDGRYSLVLKWKDEGIAAASITLTLNAARTSLAQLTFVVKYEEGREVTLIDTITHVSPAKKPLLLTLSLPRRAKKVPELPPLLPN